MRRPQRSCSALAAALLALSAAHAAPLDGLLSARPILAAPRGYVEVGVDRLNRTLDFSTSNDPAPADPAVPPASGSYRGQHLRAGLEVADGLWLAGSLWQRNIGSKGDTFRYRGWEVAGQYRFVDGAGRMPSLALRLAAFGNGSSSIESTTPVTVPGAKLDTVKVTSPGDRQLQADLLATWQPAPAWDVTAMLGVGRTKLRYDALSATTQRNGCSYQLAFTGNDIFGTLIEPCNVSGGVITQFFDSSGAYGVDVANEIAWHGRYWQTGFNVAWRGGPWTLTGGWLYHSVEREAVDDIIASRGNAVFTKNRIVSLQAAYAFTPMWTGLLRGQVSSNLFFNDIPVTYNSSTSGSFGNRYSMFTLGLRAVF